jgi:hypothetical protein
MSPGLDLPHIRLWVTASLARSPNYKWVPLHTLDMATIESLLDEETREQIEEAERESKREKTKYGDKL